MPNTDQAHFDSVAFRQWFALAIELIAQAQLRLDGENLFPVADGDTGANVLATLESGAEALAKAEGNLVELAKITARATLIEAKGNSGVILSEILRGFSQGLDQGLGAGLISAEAAAVQAVTRPMPGTILTAMAEVAASVKEGASDPQVAVAAWGAARKAALDSADNPPIPSAAGMVDAGAHALERILGALAATLDPTILPIEPLPASSVLRADQGNLPQSSDGAFEVMYLLDEVDEESATKLRARLNSLGQSVLVVGSSELWNVHVHTNDAGSAIEAGYAIGKPTRIKITSLLSASDQEVCVSTRRIVAVANGAGIAEVLRTCGAVVISAFDSRRVTPEEWWQATIGASEVLLLPQDRHGVFSAQEALAEIRNSGIRVAVLPTRSTVQALAAIAVHDPLRSFDDDLVAMTSAAGHTRYATLAFAKSSKSTSQIEYQAGDAIGIIDGEIKVAGADLAEVAQNVLRRMLAGGGELLTLLTGADSGDGLANELATAAKAIDPELEVVIHDGGQAWYPILIGVE